MATCTCGGEIGGYWAVGNVNTAIAPASVMTMDSTVAKIGRSMKKRDIMTPSGGKSEIRISKSETNSKLECSKPGVRSQRPGRYGLGHSDFELSVCFGFRISDFGRRLVALRPLAPRMA